MIEKVHVIEVRVTRAAEGVDREIDHDDRRDVIGVAVEIEDVVDRKCLLGLGCLFILIQNGSI